MENNKFNFFVPMTIEKGKDDKGTTKMKIGGIASTADIDSDNEVLLPEGFDLKPFLTNGFFNWQHGTKTSAKCIVGEPTKAEIKNNQLVVEGELYSDNELAKDIYTLAETLKKNKSKRSLGFSIEGQVIERGCGPEFLDQNKTLRNSDFSPSLWNKIKKARITGCAITPTPKNPNTLMNIIKGEYNPEGETEYETAIDSPTNNVANGGSSIIIDITRPDGQRVTVDKDLNIVIKKDLSTADNSGGSLKREDLEGSPHEKENKNIYEKNISDSKKSVTFKKILSKSEVYEEIFNKGISDIEVAKDIYNLISSIELKFNKMTQISKDTIEKAFSILNLAGAEIEKGKMEGKADAGKVDDKDKKDKDKDDDKEKVDSDKGKDAKDDKEKDSKKDEKKIEKSAIDLEIEKAEQNLLDLKAKKESGVAEIVKAIEDKPLETPKTEVSTEGNVLQKGIDIEAILKAQTTELSGKFTAIGELSKAILSQNEELKEQNNVLKGEIDKLTSRVEKVEEAPANGGHKSIITKGYVEREGEKKVGSGKTQLSVSTNKTKILDVLDKAAGMDLVKNEVKDPEFMKAMAHFEGSNSISKHIADRMFKELNIELIA